MSSPSAVLALRLAAPLQSWGGATVLNRRDTRPEPTKSGILGLLAAACGRERDDPMRDLLGLTLGVRTDQPGSLLRDYHTASDYRGTNLPSAAVNAKGRQKPTAPGKPTYVTERFYLQDAVFTAAIAGPPNTIDMLHDALRAPHYPLALGRRSCPPTNPLILDILPSPDVEHALRTIGWQAAAHHQARQNPATIRLPATIEDPAGEDTLYDVPDSFSLHQRTFTARTVRHIWITPPTGRPGGPHTPHDPFALLGA